MLRGYLSLTGKIVTNNKEFYEENNCDADELFSELIRFISSF